MPVCKFFQTNSCRFGAECRNQHVYEDTKKPSGVSILQRNKYVVNNPPKDDLNLNHHLQEINKDIRAASGMWPVSCYSYIPPYGNVQGFEDVSPEEMRFKAYEAGYNNNPLGYIADVNSAKATMMRLRQSFLDKTPEAREILSSYLRDGPAKAKEFNRSSEPKFSAGFFSSASPSASSSLFPSRAQNAGPPSGLFSSALQSDDSFSLSKHPAFQGQPQSSFTTNIFAQALNDGNPGVPTNSTQSVFNSNFFGRASQPSFGEKTSVFGEPMQDNHPFKQNIFGNGTQQNANESDMTAKQASQSSSQFGFPDSNGSSLSKTSSTYSIYSQVTDLTSQELEQFKATTFTYGKTPLKCPPKELC